MDLSAGGEAAALRTVTERLIRRIYRELRGGLGGLTAVHVEQVIRLASESASGRRAELPGGILVQRNFGDLIFSRTQRIGRRSRSRKTLSEANAYLYVVSTSGPRRRDCFRSRTE